ncbi:Cobalt/magnesium transport protein CorA [Methanosarcinaceae archaeon Ag5]|uniref:Magnesium transport protein CorA n=2 Tax=Methanolapillus africanus TaxID=3028297 RepID=A0AAE4SF25_9EURY|nr:Cobalt/magnesium transport protein CorA [Methanosarcinaceae archaeon Ag5]
MFMSAKQSQKVGLPPGSLIYITEEEETEIPESEKKVTVYAITYNESGYEEKKIESINDLKNLITDDPASAAAATAPAASAAPTTWIHVTGLWDIDVVRALGEKYGIEPLTLEDILSMGQRPKTEEFETYIYTILKHVMFDDDDKEVINDQISIITKDKTVISFAEKSYNIFDPVIKRLKKDGRIRKYGADYLTYALIDVVVDNYFLVMEQFEEWFDEVEKRMVSHPEKESAGEINRMRTELFLFNKAVWPLINVTDSLEKSESKLIKKPTRVYFRDVQDHVTRIVESIETGRETVTGIFDIYNSGISKRLNETMKVLTVISTIFIPLTFIVGVYGMNFEYMPELYWKYGYYACLGLMLLIFVTMILYFKKRGWY